MQKDSQTNMAKVLIVEDDKYLASAYRVKLTKAGFDIKIAMDGEEAIEVVNSFLPDLIILDLLMPKKDGFATLEELRKDSKWKKIPIIIASNLGQKEDIERGMKLGATDFIIKSELNLNDLVSRIQKLVHATST